MPSRGGSILKNALTRQKLGLSLAETIVALFIITVGVLEITGLFQNAYASQQRAVRIATATAIANRRLGEVQEASSALTDFTDWTSIDGTKNDTEFPDFVVVTTSTPTPLYSPCSLKELAYPAGDRRVVQQSLRRVEVAVKWDPSKPREQVRFVAMVGAPPPPRSPSGDFDLYKVDLQSPPASPVTGVTSLSIYGQDGQSTPKRIPDLFYGWTLLPGTGNGQLIEARDGRSANLDNKIIDPITLTPIPAYGTVTIGGRARYMGVEKSFNKSVVLGP